jgi:2-aminoadipate transaminase
VISFSRGVPAPECLPVDELAECARSVLLADGRTVLSYGSPSGYEPLREWIAQRHGVSVDRVFVTNGGLQGFVFFAHRLAANGERVLVEQPTYDRPLKILRELGAEIVSLPMDEEGLQPETLERALADGSKPAFLYTIPTFQNPSGRTLSLERRRRIVELAERHELLVLEDDPYGLVRFEGEPQPALLDLGAGDRVVYASSFSKTVAPGLRVGYFVLPSSLRAELEATSTSTYITPGLIGQATVYEFIRRGNFDTNLERVRQLLGVRRDAMLESLETALAGTGATWSRPQGGYFVWLDVPGVDTRELLGRSTGAGVSFVAGSDFGGAPSAARLAYSFVSPDEIREGVPKLASLLPSASPI